MAKESSLKVVIDGKPLPNWTDDEVAVHHLLSDQRGWHASPLGLTRWIRKQPDAAAADAAIVAAAEKLWATGFVHKDEDGNFFTD